VDLLKAALRLVQVVPPFELVEKPAKIRPRVHLRRIRRIDGEGLDIRAPNRDTAACPAACPRSCFCKDSAVRSRGRGDFRTRPTLFVGFVGSITRARTSVDIIPLLTAVQVLPPLVLLKIPPSLVAA
jgi:hypothetical protein